MAKLIKTNPSIEILPNDILSNIFSRLSIKCLLRFKSVCKSWRFVITSRHFAMLHQQRNLSVERLLIFVAKDRFLYYVSLDFPELPAIKIPRTSRWEHFSRKKIMGSCNGLLLCINDEDLETLLINPSTFPPKWVPKLQLPQSCLYVRYGFGYDSIMDDYKVVRITHFLHKRFGMNINVGVYSLRSDNWKVMDHRFDVDGAPPTSQEGALISTHLIHWLFCDVHETEFRIVCFDVCHERWSDVPLPDLDFGRGLEEGDGGGDDDNVVNFHSKPVDLGVLDGCLRLLTSSKREFVHANVWVMKEYGVQESWVTLFDISDTCIFDRLRYAPIVYSKEGGEILMRKDLFPQAFWYDLSEKTTRIAEFHDLSEFYQVSVCTRSLVHLFGHDD